MTNYEIVDWLKSDKSMYNRMIIGIPINFNRINIIIDAIKKIYLMAFGLKANVLNLSANNLMLEFNK